MMVNVLGPPPGGEWGPDETGFRGRIIVLWRVI